MKKLIGSVPTALIILLIILTLTIVLTALSLSPNRQGLASDGKVTGTNPAGASVCFQHGSETLLVVGVNTPEFEAKSRRGADAIRLVKVDFDHRAGVVLALPPDLWVNVPEVLETETGGAKLTDAFARLRGLASGSRNEQTLAALQEIALILKDNFKVSIDHTMGLSEDAFVQVVDALGGVTLEVPADLDATAQGYGIFKAGKQKLTGQQALDYARMEIPVNGKEAIEAARTQRQDQVLITLAKQLVHNPPVSELVELYKIFQRSSTSDLNLAQMSGLLCGGWEAQRNIEFIEFDARQFKVGADGRLVPNPSYLAKLINKVK